MSATRDDLAAEALALQQQGLGYKRIGRALGVSPTTARRLLLPGYRERLALSSNAAKKRRTGTCSECGGETRYNGHNGVAISTLCAGCGSAKGAATQRERLAGNGPMQMRLRALLVDGPLRFSDIRDALGTPNGHTGNLLHRLVKHGKIARISRGLYRLTDQP